MSVSMTANEIAAVLGDSFHDGRDVRTKCPSCGGPLALRDGERGLMAKCWGGCDAADVYAELRHRKLISGKRPPSPLAGVVAAAKADATRKTMARVANALDQWEHALPIKDTRGDRYLREARGIDVLSPYVGESAEHVLRFCPRCWHSSPGIYRPAVVAKIEHTHRGFIGIHVTYLAVDGSNKTTLGPPRKIFGVCMGGAVRLGNPDANRWFIVGEGIETTLSVVQACALPGWAALSSGGIMKLVLPPEARMVVIAADNDVNGVGQRNARRAAARFCGEGRHARIFTPPGPGTDWNDVLLGKALANAAKAEHAA
jgi:putative DNA primase/helicase